MSGRLRWCYEDFCWFYEQLTLPDGGNAGLEGFHRLILREVFRGGAERVFRQGHQRADELASGLVLIPKGQAKTTLMAGLAVFHLLVVRNANCYIGAADKIQAKEMYRFASHFVDSEPDIAARLKVVKSTYLIESRVDQGFIQIIASDDSKDGGKKQGFNPTLALIDELHAHENDNLYVDMQTGLFKRNGLLMTVTTAGWDLGSVLGKTRADLLAADQHGGTVEHALIATPEGDVYQDIKLGRLTRARTGRNVMLEWALRPKGHPLGADDPEDDHVVKLANPASWVTPETLADARRLPGVTPWHFRRYRCNLWTLAFASWLPEDAWYSLQHPAVTVLESRSWLGATDEEVAAHVRLLFPPGSRVVGALDMARYRDCAAIVALGVGPDGLVLVRAMIWRSGGPDNPVPYGPIEHAIRKLDEFYELQALGYDPKYFDKSGATLEGEDVPVEEFPQSNERMCPAAADLRYAIVTEKRFAHDGDAILTAHIMAAVAADVGDGAFKLVKSKQTGPPIDGCVSFAMAHALDLLDDGGSMYDLPEANV